MSDRSAVISIGTNSTRLLAVDFAAKRFGVFGDPVTRILKARSVGTRIGEGLKESGHLSEEAMQRTLEV
ncbi:MAG: exopolyphosphatase, partial [Candidatus Eremiobacteraeota bacterium]|nr:exopolyphosphatase [Candidatus Eremiobacteraeota bacterium]